MKTVVSVEVEKEAHELAEAVADIVVSAKEAVKDGFQAGQDLTVVVGGNLTKLMTAVAGVEQLPAEAKEDMQAFLNAWTLAGNRIAAAFLKKAEAPVAQA